MASVTPDTRQSVFHRPKLAGRLLLSFVLIIAIVTMIGFLWFGEEHIFNPAWHPHARFHVAQELFGSVTFAFIDLWLVWRHSLESRIVRLVATAFPALFSAGAIFASFVPGTSASPDLAHPNTFSVFGLSIHGNLFFFGVMVVLSVVAYLLLSRGSQNPD